MDTGLQVQDLTFGSLFKIMFAAAMVFWLIGGLVLGLSALAGYDTVSFNDTHIHGVGGLIIGMLIAILMGGVFGALGSVCGALVLKLFGWALPIGTLRAKRDRLQGEGALAE
ncbi:MAG: hypothetical protein U9P68_06350 [Pseudomonadota bacterium]|nr:hypothetical protein [Pseudomonadota bacterium]